MPVAIWSMNRARVALPNTYHQLAVERGTRWARMGWTTAPIPARSSIHRLTLRSRSASRATASLHRPRERGQLAAAHPEMAVPHLVLVLVEAPRRRPGGARAVLVVGA